MTIINATPDRTIHIGYEGEDNVTKIIFRYDSEWLSHGNGVFSIRVLRHGEHEAYNASKVRVDKDDMEIEMTVTDVCRGETVRLYQGGKEVRCRSCTSARTS